ncbi:MAG: class I SAM-dependent methyltransferase [Cellulomonadaceae bacterium]
MTIYKTVIDPDVLNSSHSAILRLVGTDRRVLDVGCATGYLAKALRDQGCEVSGVEYDPIAAEQARPLLDQLIVGNLNQISLTDAFGGSTFDVIVFGDVLEHLLDPAATLRDAVGLLAPGGQIVASIPNIAHGSIRLALLQGAWEYRDTGLLDRTHVRFFTRDGVDELLDLAGLVPTQVQAVVLDPLGTEVRVDQTRLPEGVVDWVRSQPEAQTYQYVLRARPADAPGDPRTTTVDPVMVLPTPVDGQVPGEVIATMARLVNERNAREAASVVELRHRLLTARDNAIGLEQTTRQAQIDHAVVQAELIETHEILGKVLAENTRMDAVIRDRDHQLALIHASRLYRAVRAVRHPLRFLRGGRS